MHSGKYELCKFGGDASAPGADLASLHAQILPHSPVALLGQRFMEQYYYRVLPRENYTFGAVAYLDSKAVGFVVACTDSAGFMSEALRHHWLSLAWISTKSVLAQPSRIAAIWEAWQILRDVTADKPDVSTGELLSIGVLPEYRTAEFNERTGLNIGLDLRRLAVAELRARNVAAVRTVVDADNLIGNVFYRADGWTLSRDDLKGWSKPSVEYSKRL